MLAHRPTRRNIPETVNRHCHRHGNLKFRNLTNAMYRRGT